MSTPRLALLSDPLFMQHDPGFGHPERGERLSAILEHLAQEGLLGEMERIEGHAASPEELQLVHSSGHVEGILALRSRSFAIDPDTAVSSGSVDAAELAAGGSIDLLRTVVESRGRGLALLRPPGHHATPDRAMGFCLFNNLAVATAKLLEAGAVERVLVVDWDVHHGNGTQDTFYADPRVLYFSVHQYPFFPGTGHHTEMGDGKGRGRTVNVPLPAGTGDAEVLAAFRELLRPLADRFEPQLVVVSAGFDGHRFDPLAGWDLSEAGYLALAREVDCIARDHCDGSWAAFLEGGYNLQATAASVGEVARVLMGRETDEPRPAPGPCSSRIIEDLRAVFRSARVL